MPNPGVAVYTAHMAFWAAFVFTRILMRRRGRIQEEAGERAPNSHPQSTARFSRTLLAFHALAFGVMYSGIALAVIPRRVPDWFAGQRIIGLILIAAATALVVWTLFYFRSWRFRATVDETHELATGGPFRMIRHPIYMGLNLLALGSAIWVPSAIVWLGFVLMAIGGDLRARAEEIILAEAFESSYREYCARTRRFLPGLY